MNAKSIILVTITFFISNYALAYGVDETYTKSNNDITWGDKFLSFFNIGDYSKRKSHALVIGVSDYDDFRDLPTKQDPIKLKNFLLNEAGFDYVHLLTGEQVTIEKIRILMEDSFPRRVGRNDRFLFYWSGHGVTRNTNYGENKGYLPVANSKENVFSGMVSMDKIRYWDSLLKNSKQTLYLIDSCFSGLTGVVPQSDSKSLTLRQLSQSSRQILTAGTGNEQTIAVNGGSVFTTALLEGLRGSADTSSNQFPIDGVISVSELKIYIRKRVGELSKQFNWNRLITPTSRDLAANDGEFFFFTPETVQRARDGAGRNNFQTYVSIPLPKSGSSPIQRQQPWVLINNLLWLASSSPPRSMNLASAQNYASKHIVNGIRGWRLPSLDELKAAGPVLKRHPSYSNKEVWASSHNGKIASYDIRRSNPYSNLKNPHKNKYVILVKNKE